MAELSDRHFWREGYDKAFMGLGLDVEAAAQFAMVFGVLSFIGEHGADAGDERKSSREQPLESKRVIDVRGCGDAGERHAVCLGCDRGRGALLAAIGRP